MPAAAVVAVVAVLLLAEPWGADASDTVGNAGYLLGAGLGLAFALAGARRRTGQTRLALLCIAAAELCWLVANAYWMTWERVVTARPFAFWTPYDFAPFGDAVYLTAAALLIAATVVLLRRIVSSGSTFRLVLDSMLVTASVFYVVWALVLGHLPPFGWNVDRAISWAYPILDIALAAVALIALSRSSRPDRTRWLLLSGAMVVMAAGDVYWAYTNVVGAFEAGLPVDVVWVAGYAMVGLAALAGADGDDLPQRVSARWTSFVPYVPVLAVLITTLVMLDEGHDHVLTVTGVVVVGLLVLRQVVAVLENQRLARNLEAAVAARTAELAKLAAIVDVGRDAMVTVSVPGHRVLTWNPAATAIFGYDAGEAAGANLEALLCGDERAVSAGTAAPVEVELRRRDGTRVPVSVLSAPISDDRGEVVAAAVVLRDVTERRAVEEQLRHAQKMEAVGRLAAGVAHDFNNLLTVIGGCAEFALSSDAASDPELRRELTEISAANRRATELTRKLLAFSRKQVLQSEVLDLNEIVAEHASMLRSILGVDVTLRLDLGSDDVFVEADQGQLSQVLLNLAANARDAMPAGGDFTIRTRAVDPAQLGDAGRDGVPFVVLEVADTGTGIDDDVKQHLFEPFFTTKQVGKGTGLGLSMVLGIVEQSGGRIVVDSELGTGTTFRIYLPRAARVARRRPEDAASERPART